jgi:hypothetical protein
MHKTIKSIINKIKQLEKRELTEEQQKALDALKVLLAVYQNKLAKGLAFSSDDERALDALEIIVNYMVKDSSVT